LKKLLTFLYRCPVLAVLAQPNHARMPKPMRLHPKRSRISPQVCSSSIKWLGHRYSEAERKWCLFIKGEGLPASVVGELLHVAFGLPSYPGLPFPASRREQLCGDATAEVDQPRSKRLAHNLTKHQREPAYEKRSVGIPRPRGFRLALAERFGADKPSHRRTCDRSRLHCVGVAPKRHRSCGEHNQCHHGKVCCVTLSIIDVQGSSVTVGGILAYAGAATMWR